MVWGVSPTLPALIWVLQEGDTRAGLDTQGLMWGSTQRPANGEGAGEGRKSELSDYSVVKSDSDQRRKRGRAGRNVLD